MITRRLETIGCERLTAGFDFVGGGKSFQRAQLYLKGLPMIVQIPILKPLFPGNHLEAD